MGKLPEWIPPESHEDPKFASRVRGGVVLDQESGVRRRGRRTLSLEEYKAGILAGDLTILSRAITLIESQRQDDQILAQALLSRILPRTGNSKRIGISGVPGVGKSNFIEGLGCLLGDSGHRVAVLAVDPSSSVSGGSILGDKTRMTHLVGHPNAFIRPSPSAGSLGGVAKKSRETILLCEAAGFDVILVETVGTGQNEITVRSMVDCFLLLLIAGAGDDLQGMKKGIMEIADVVAVNKADGDNKTRAQLACSQTNRALHLLQPATAGWRTQCVTCSALSRDSMQSLWEELEVFFRHVNDSGTLEERRRLQAVDWMNSMIEEELKSRFRCHPAVGLALPGLAASVAEATMPAALAARRLLDAFFTDIDGSAQNR